MADAPLAADAPRGLQKDVRPGLARQALVSTDNGIIMCRHKLMRAARALADKGTLPPGRSPEEQQIRSFAVVLPRDVAYKDKAAELARAGVPLGAPIPRDLVADQILRETLLTVSSDWPFMVSKDSAADYARYRAHLHAHATREIADAHAAGRHDTATRLAEGWNRADGLFGALDARRLPR